MIELANIAKPVLLAQKLPYLRSLTCRLYQNDLTPDGETSAGDFVEATFDGYVDKPLSSFGPTYLNSSKRGETDTCKLIWVTTGNPQYQLIYGYYATDPMGYLIFSERFDAGPFAVNGSGLPLEMVISFEEETLR